MDDCQTNSRNVQKKESTKVQQKLTPITRHDSQVGPSWVQVALIE